MVDAKLISSAKIENLVINGIKSIDDCEYLGNSLFYYCCGKDPTPVIAFGSQYPLYIYVDNDATELQTTVNILNGRIQAKNYSIVESRFIPRAKWHGACIITKWSDQCGKCFFLIYFQEDAEKIFSRVYGYEINYVQPKCICNIRHNLRKMGIISQLEKRVQWIMGHCYNEKYYEESQHPYYGDYQEGKVSLYCRRFYFLF